MSMNKVLLKQEQPIVYQTLSNALKKQRLSHAYLFVGPKGSPKKETALLFAQSIVCSHTDEDGFACQTCDTCKRIEHEESIDFKWFHGDVSRIKKSDVILLQEFFSSTSVEDENKRVYILEQFDGSTPDASNSLLKFLEEPAEGIYGILTADDKSGVLPTIQSRCQWVQFRPASKKRLLEALSEMTDTEVANMLIESGYTLEKAQELLECEEFEIIRNAAKEYCENQMSMSAILKMQTRVLIPKSPIMKKEWGRLWLEWILFLVKHGQVSVTMSQRVQLQTILIESMDILSRPVDLALLLDQVYNKIRKVVIK